MASERTLSARPRPANPTPEAEADLMRAQCLKEKVYPHDLARMVLWLASDDSRMHVATVGRRRRAVVMATVRKAEVHRERRDDQPSSSMHADSETPTWWRSASTS